MVKLTFKGKRQNIRLRTLKKAIDIIEVVKKLEDNGQFGKVTSKSIAEELSKEGKTFSPTTAYMFAYFGFLFFSSKGFWSKNNNMYQYRSTWRSVNNKKYSVDVLKEALKSYEEYQLNKEKEDL